MTEEIHFIEMLGRGGFLMDLHEKRLGLEAAIAATGKKGKLTIEIIIEPEGTRRMLRYEIKAKAPVAANPTTFAFATNAGQYVENDPSQMSLPLHAIPAPRPVQTFTMVQEPEAVPLPVAANH